MKEKQVTVVFGPTSSKTIPLSEALIGWGQAIQRMQKSASDFHKIEEAAYRRACLEALKP